MRGVGAPLPGKVTRGRGEMCKLSHHVSSSCVSLTAAPLGAGGRGPGTTVGAGSASELQTALTSAAHELNAELESFQASAYFIGLMLHLSVIQVNTSACYCAASEKYLLTCTSDLCSLISDCVPQNSTECQYNSRDQLCLTLHPKL